MQKSRQVLESLIVSILQMQSSHLVFCKCQHVYIWLLPIDQVNWMVVLGTTTA